MRSPVDQPYTITTHFKNPVPGSYFGVHLGTDFALPTGRNVLACINSTITRTGNSPEVGLFIEATGDDGMYYRYLHNSVLKVSAGQKVSEGQIISLVGSTGSVSTGSHCHIDIRRPSLWNQSIDNYVDPEQYLKQGDGMNYEQAINDLSTNLTSQINALNDQLNQTNTYVGELQTQNAEQEKQLNNTNKAVDALTARVEKLEQGGVPPPANGTVLKPGNYIVK